MTVWVNVPFAAVGLILAWRFIPTDGPVGHTRLDAVGLLLLLSPAVVGVLSGLSNASHSDGFARFDVWAPLGAGVLLLVVFIVGPAAVGRLPHRPQPSCDTAPSPQRPV